MSIKKTRYSINSLLQSPRLSPADDLGNRFTYHPPKGDQTDRYGDIRKAACDYALLLSTLCPQSRELSTALTKLDEVVFFSNAAIARNE
jgi:hypothetical protein